MPGPHRCIRLITHAWRNQLFRLPPKEDYHVYITRSIYHYAYRTTGVSQLEKINKEKQKKKKGKERKEKKTKQNEKGKKREEEDKKSKKRQDKKRKQGKEKRREERKKKTKRKRNVILADPGNWLRMALG